MKKVWFVIISTLLSVIFCINAFAGTWKNNNTGWWYQEDDGSYSTNSWKEINGNWYYFNERGYMLSDTVTPDGYKVSKSGEWIQTDDVKPETLGEKYVVDEWGSSVGIGSVPEGEYVYYSSDIPKIPVVDGSSSLSSNFNYVKLLKGDKLKMGIYIPVSDAGELDITKEGVFKVGRDIKEGTYILTPFERDGSLIISMCLVFNSIPSSKDESSPQKNINQEFYVHRSKTKTTTVTVVDGQYIQIFGCSADFVRP